MKEVWHIEPRNDLKPHLLSGNGCKCEPQIQNLPDRILVIHNSYDGREFWEDMLKEFENDEVEH